MPAQESFDLVFQRRVPLAPETLFRAWTQPAWLTRWFTPAPWRTLEAQVDLRPGGIFRTVMRGPEGETHDNAGCWLEVVPHHRLVWTDAFLPGWQPAPQPFVTAILTFEAGEGGTLYTAIARHKDAEDQARHEAMGFQTGWGAALDQLVALAKAGGP
jgi:uncharacterized protein YndB with AHSA1/START domain